MKENKNHQSELEVTQPRFGRNAFHVGMPETVWGINMHYFRMEGGRKIEGNGLSVATRGGLAIS
jgi:hypothetical protein